MTDSTTPIEKKSATVVMLGRCPMCKQRATLEYRPFCSKRCSDLDLSKWLGGSYAIPVEESELSEEDLLNGLSPD
jgi:hypothetical protein